MATIVLPLSARVKSMLGLLETNFLVEIKAAMMFRSHLLVNAFLLNLYMNGKSLFLSTLLFWVLSLYKLFFNDLMHSIVSLFLLVDGTQKFSPNCNNPITSLGIDLLLILINQFFLGSSRSTLFLLKFVDFNSITCIGSNDSSWNEYLLSCLLIEQ